MNLVRIHSDAGQAPGSPRLALKSRLMGTLSSGLSPAWGRGQQKILQQDTGIVTDTYINSCFGMIARVGGKCCFVWQGFIFDTSRYLIVHLSFFICKRVLLVFLENQVVPPKGRSSALSFVTIGNTINLSRACQHRMMELAITLAAYPTLMCCSDNLTAFV